jgi:hypothetical protein
VKKICTLLVIMMTFMTGCGGSVEKEAGTPAPAAEASDPERIIDFSKAELTSENVKAAITDKPIRDKVTDVLIDGGDITVVVFLQDLFSLEAYIKGNQTCSAVVFRDLFKNPNVTSVTYQSDLEAVDAYGAANRVTGMTNTMLRDDADKVQDWDYLKYESPSRFYSIVEFELDPDAKISEIYAAWGKVYE